MSMPPMDDIEYDVDVDIDDLFEGEPSDGAHPRIIVFMDPTLWRHFMLKNDLNPETLRWFFFFNSLTLRFLTKDNRCMVKLETLKKRCLGDNPRLFFFYLPFLLLFLCSMLAFDLSPLFSLYMPLLCLH